MVFDTSLLAAFDVPDVDPAAQQQAANLLSQQAYQPQSISPPSFTGGGGLAESRPQTVTQGAPYYDPIAIHQGAAPVNYQYTGPTVDMSGYLGLGTYMGIPRQPNQSTDYLNTVNEEYSTIDRGLANTIQGIQRGGPMPPENVINQLNYYNPLYDSQYQQPAPQYGTTNRPGTLGGLLDVQRAGQSQYGAIPGGLINAGMDLYNTDIPIYSDFARNYIKPAVSKFGELAFPGAEAVGDALPVVPSPSQLSSFVPVTLGDVALELIPGVGTVPDAWRAASRLSPDLTDFSRVIREGGQNVSQRLGPSELGAARVPKTPDAINAISRRLKGGDEKPIFEGIEQAAETPVPPKPLPGTEAYARGRGTTAPPPDYSQDPGYLESLARMADTGVANPARTKTTAPAQRTVTQGDGTVLPATDETIKAAVDRFTRRASSAKKLKTDPVADPEGFLDELANIVVTEKTYRGLPLMQGVTKEEVKQALINVNNAVDTAFKAADAPLVPPKTPRVKGDPELKAILKASQAQQTEQQRSIRAIGKLEAQGEREAIAAERANQLRLDRADAKEAARQQALFSQYLKWTDGIPTDTIDDIDHFTQMTRGVIENNSLVQSVYDAARPLTRWVSGDVADSKLAELIAREAELRTYLKELDPKTINRAVRNWRAEQLARYFSGDELKKAAKFMQQNTKTRTNRDFTDEISDTLKATALNLDFAVAGQQVEAGLRRGSVPIATGIVRDAANRIATKLHMPGAMEVYLRNDIDHVKQAIADGVQMGGGETANISARGRSLFGRIPKIGGPIESGLDKLADLQYGAILGTMRLRAYEGLLLQNKVIHDLTFGKLGGDITDPLVRRHIAEQANMIGSTSREASQAIRSRAENKLLLTSRMTRAQVNEIITPLKSLRSQEDVINTMNLLGSIAVYMGAAKVANDQFGIGDFVWDPLEQGFGQIKTNVEDKTGRKQILDFMPQDALSTAIIRSINAWKDEDWDRLRDSWLRLGAGRLNMLPSNILKLTGYGYDTKGRFHGPDDERMSLKEGASGSLPIPLTARDIANDQSTFNIATAVTGQGNFPENETQVKDRLAVEMFGQPSETYPNGVKSYSELYNTDKDIIDANSATQAAEAFNGPTPLDLVGKQKEVDRNTAATGQVPEGAVDWLKNSGLKPASEIDRQLAAGEITGAEARAAYQALREELVRRDMQNRESPEVQKQLAEIEKAVAEKGEQSLSPAEKAQRDYYAMLDAANASGTFDFDLYNQKLDEWVAQYGDQRDLISASRAPLSPGEAELKELRTQLDSVGWFDSYDRGYQSILRNNPQVAAKFGQYQDYDSFEAGMKQRITDSLRRQYGTQYIDQDKVNDIFFDILVGEGIMQAVNVVEAVILYRNPSLMQPIQKWYDLDEGEMKILEEIRRSNGAVAR